MPRLSFRTAGESHGPTLISLVEGLPAGVVVDDELINGELRRRQGGYGRGGRQKIETDVANYLTGVRRGADDVRRTIGSPVTMAVKNKDNRLDDPEKTPPLTRPRPGHADLAGRHKWLTTDCRETLERASARETAARVAAGALAKCLLQQFDIHVLGFVRQVGEARGQFDVELDNWRDMKTARDANDLYCPDEQAAEQMREFIRQQKMAKDTAGGVVECHVFGCPVGLGSSMTIDGRLDGRIGQAVMSIQAFKGVEIGMGFGVAALPGSKVHDEIFFEGSMCDEPTLGFERTTNNAGGLEGGMTNGQPIVVRGAMKPISTLGKPLRSVDLSTKEASEAGWERSDISAISAASVVMENVIAFAVADALCEKLGGDSVAEMRLHYDAYLEAARRLPLEG
ncbi:MAG: chorismate synthase [Planctomycetota bacterium]